MKERSWREYLASLFIAAILAVMVRFFFVTAYKVPTGSMQPTLKPGDFIFATRFDYGTRWPWSETVHFQKLPERGDIVVFSYPSQPQVNYVKRVVGLPGDVIELNHGDLILNGEKFSYLDASNDRLTDNPNQAMFRVLLESSSKTGSIAIIREKAKASPNFGPLTVPKGEIFLLGDNRDASDDSRYWGTVPTGQIFGKVRWVWLSLDSQSRWAADRLPSVRWVRVFTRVN